MPTTPATAPWKKPSGASGSDAVLTAWFGQTPTWGQRQEILQMAGIALSPLQLAPLQGRLPDGKPAKTVLLSGAEQGGKSLVTAADLLTWTPWIRHDRQGNPLEAWIVGPDYDQAQREAGYWAEWAQALGWLKPGGVSTPKGQEPWSFETIFGGIVKTRSAVNERKLAGTSPMWVGMVEAGQQTVTAYRTLSRRARYRGFKLMVSGTLEGLNWYSQEFDRLQQPNPYGVSFRLPQYANPDLYPQGEASPNWQALVQELRAEGRESEIHEKLLGYPQKPRLLVFHDFDEATHARAIVLSDPPAEPAPNTIYLPGDTPVEVWFDNGARVYAALAVALFRETVYLLDEIYYRECPSGYDVIAEAKRRFWWPNVRDAVGDHASTQRMGGVPAIELWRQAPPLGAGLRVVSNHVLPETYFPLIHHKLRPKPPRGEPDLYLDPDRCPNTLAEFTRHCQFENEHTDRPRHFGRDAISAIGFGLFARFGVLGEAPPSGYGGHAPEPFPWERTA